MLTSIFPLYFPSRSSVLLGSVVDSVHSVLQCTSVEPPRTEPVETGNLWKLGEKVELVPSPTQMHLYKGELVRNGEILF